MVDSTSNSLPSPFKSMALPVTSPNSKLSLTSPKRGQKREEGWKEVVRRSVLFLKAIYIECFKCLFARFIIHIFQLDDNLHRQQCWLHFNFSCIFSFNHGILYAIGMCINNNSHVLFFEDQRSSLCQHPWSLGSWGEEAATSQPSRT